MRLSALLYICLTIGGSAQIKEWCRKGQECIDNGDGMGAAQYYKQCCDYIGTGRNMIPLTSSLSNIAGIYEKAGNYTEAEKYIQRSIGLGKVLGRTGSQALRYLDASRINLAMGNAEKALSYAGEGLQIAYQSNNENTIGQLLMQLGNCYSRAGEHRISDSLYSKAVEWLYVRGKGRTYVPQAYLKLGNNAIERGDTATARIYYEKMLDETRWGYDQSQMYTACNILCEILPSDDPASEKYRKMADSLDFVPMVEALGINLMLCNLEFPRLERERQLAAEKQHSRMLTYIAVLCVLLICLALITVFILRCNLKQAEARNASLIKANLQKEALLSIARSVTSKLEEVNKISDDEIPIPEVKLTRRETQIARLAAQGKLNKEIADELGISIGTVAVHKNNLFRKLGVGNTVELMRCIQKIGL